jgi:hypothetical protein
LSSSSSSSFESPPPLDAFPVIFTGLTLPQQGCTYSRDGTPVPMQGLANKIWQDILLLVTQPTTSVSTSIGVLHIRRGDSASWCKTTLQECSLHGLPPTMILLASDKMDPVYPASIQSLLKILGSHAMIAFDAFVWDRIQHLKNHALHNNYYVYGMGPHPTLEEPCSTQYLLCLRNQNLAQNCLLHRFCLATMATP